MISINVKYVDRTPQVMKAVDKGDFKSFAHAAASLRKAIIAGVKVNKEVLGWITTNRLSKRGKRIRARIYRPSPVGSPVYSHKSKGWVSRGVKFEANKDGAVIGFAHSVYGDVMHAHEFGDWRKGQKFDPRPTVRPALDQNINRITSYWRGSITS